MSKTILVSNRLPVTVKKEGKEILYSSSSGGLATGLKSLTEKKECLWLGYPGIVSDLLKKNERDNILEIMQKEYKCMPIFLSEEEVELFYDGFSNGTIWPLFHYFQGSVTYEGAMWKVYETVNKKFAQELLEYANEDDVIWVNDYHLMLLPKLIREKLPKVKIGFFLHIPFPSHEIFRLLPWREEILNGLLGSDLIGFHTMSYARHFLNSLQYLLGIENNLGTIAIEERNVRVDTFPMGIDYKMFAEGVERDEVKDEIDEILRNISDQKIIVSIDRLDYTKGLIQRLESFDFFLDKYPEYINKVTLIMVAVPSRIDVEEYANLTNRLEMLVSRINGKYSTMNWAPIKYLYRSIPFETLEAIYAVGDVALITPLRDGMNLVAKEFIAAKDKIKKGVLILSEMAGVSEELGEALIINPNNTEQIADTIKAAFEMPEDKQAQLLQMMQMRIKRNDVFKWANDFVDRLSNLSSNDNRLKIKKLGQTEIEVIKNKIENSKKRLLFLDYDGTLVGFQAKYNQASPDADLMKMLETLIKEEKNRLTIISGRDKDTLNHWFGHLNINLVAEHGSWVRQNGGEWIETISNINNEWKDGIRSILESFVDRTPKSSIEEKNHALVWHYRTADKDLAEIRLKELKTIILETIANRNLTMMDGNKILEIKRNDIDKGKIVLSLLTKETPDFVLAAGDDLTDEDMFKVLKDFEYAETIKVGNGSSNAQFWVSNPKEVRKFLNEVLINQEKEE